MTDFTKQEERVNDDVKQLKRIGKRLDIEEKADVVIELLGLSIRLKNRIAQELGQMRAFEKGGIKRSNRILVYSKFDENIHVIDNIFNPSLPITLSIKWGGIDPFVALVWQKIAGRGDVIVDEVYEGCIDNNRFIELCKEKEWWKYIYGITAYCDPSRQDLIREWREEGIHLMGDRSLIEDINLVRAKIAPMKGDPTLFVDRKCEMVIWEFNHYKTDKDGYPINKSDNAMDAIRNYVKGITRKQRRNKMTELDSQKKLRQKTGGKLTEKFQDEADKLDNEFKELGKKYLPDISKLKAKLDIEKEDCTKLHFASGPIGSQT